MQHCATTHEWEDTVNRICKPCDASCLTCNGNNSNNCLSCAAPLYYLNNICYVKCPINFYGALNA